MKDLPACIGRIETRCCNECRNCDSFCRCIHQAIEMAVGRALDNMLIMQGKELTGG